MMDKINILLLGSGGRESALAWKMAQSELTGKLFIAPGNGGTEAYGTISLLRTTSEWWLWVMKTLL